MADWDDEDDEIDWDAVERQALEQARGGQAHGGAQPPAPPPLAPQPQAQLPAPGVGVCLPVGDAPAFAACQQRQPQGLPPLPPSARQPAVPQPPAPIPCPPAGPTSDSRHAGQLPGAAAGMPGAAFSPAAAELRRRVQEFQAVVQKLPPRPPKSPVCPGVYGRGCGGRLRWCCFDNPAWAHWACSIYNCAYREYPPPRKSGPELSIQLDTPDTVQVTALPGAEEAVVHCGGVEVVLRAAGVELRRALPAPPPSMHQQQQQPADRQPAGVLAAAGALAAPDAAEPACRVQSAPPSPSGQRQVQPSTASPPRVARLVRSLPTSPAGHWRQGQAAPEPGQLLSRAARSLPASPLLCHGPHSPGQTRPVLSILAGVLQRLPGGSQQGAASGEQAVQGTAEEPAGGAQQPPRQQHEGQVKEQQPGGDSCGAAPSSPSRPGGGSAARRAAGLQPGSVRFPLADYERVRDTLSAFSQQSKIVLLRAAGHIPRATLLACRGQLFTKPSPAEAQQRYAALPPFLEAALMPFQREGVQFGLARSGKCMLADEMGVGKTVQAIALASCYREEWPLLIVVPASLRLVWAEELEKWLPQVRPCHIHVIEGKEGRVAPPNLPLITITSFEMMQRLTCDACKQRGQHQPGTCANAGRRCTGAQLCMAAMGWRVIIVDESHQLRTSNKPPDAQHTEAVISAVRRARRAVFLTGTPSLSRPYDLFRQVDALKPGLLGRDRFEFAGAYCNRRAVPLPGGEGKQRFDNSGLARATELHGLLRREVMLRRLKRDVLSQLPPKRRQVIRLPKPKAEHWPKQPKGAKRQAGGSGGSDSEGGGGGASDGDDEMLDEQQEEGSADAAASGQGMEAARRQPAFMSAAHRTGLAKLPSVVEWVMHALGARKASGRGPQAAALEQEEDEGVQGGSAQDGGPKLLLFAHHRDVMNGLAAALDGAAGYSAVPFVRIDGASDGEERRAAAARFRADPAVRVALLSVTAAGVGLDLSCASVVVFAELPEDPSWVRQAEDRAHRKGQTLPVNVYFLCAKGTEDERRWQLLSRALARVTAVLDGEEAPAPAPKAAGPAAAAAGGAAEDGALPTAGGSAAAQAAAGAGWSPAFRGGLAVDEIADVEVAGMTQAVPLLGGGGSGRAGLCCAAVPGEDSTEAGGEGSREAMDAQAQQEQQRQRQQREEEMPPASSSPRNPTLAAAAARTLQPEVGGATMAGAASRVLELQAQGSAAATSAVPCEAEEPVQVWFEVSGNTSRIHFHAAPDGSRPLRLSLPMEALTGPPDSPLIEELLQAVGSPRSLPAAAAAVAGEPGVGVEQQQQQQPCGGDVDMGQAGHSRGLLDPGAPAPAVPCGTCERAHPFQTGQSCQPAAAQSVPAPVSQAQPAAAACQPDGGQCSARPLAAVVVGIGPVALDAGLRRPALAAMIAEARAFAAEWRELRAVHQSRLAGRVLQAPLDQVVEALQKEAAAAGAYGTSTNRFVESSRSDLELPAGAEWRVVRVRFPRLVNPVEYRQPFLPKGGRLCLNCAAAVPGGEQLAQEETLQGMSMLFCSAQCEARFALKCNGSAYRRALFKLERGVCVTCKLDCHDLVRRLQAIEKGGHRWEQKRQVLVAQLAPRFLQHGHKAQLERLVKNAVEGNAWQADHIRPVYQGGGLCNVENLRTLCTLCHLEVTKRQAKERAAERAAALGEPVPKGLKRRARVTRHILDTDSPAARPAAAVGPAGHAAAQSLAAAAAEVAAAMLRGTADSAVPAGVAGEEGGGSNVLAPEAAASGAQPLPKCARGKAVGAAAGGAGAGGAAAQQGRPAKRQPRLKRLFLDDEDDDWKATSSAATSAGPNETAGSGTAGGSRAEASEGASAAAGTPFAPRQAAGPVGEGPAAAGAEPAPKGGGILRQARRRQQGAGAAGGGAGGGRAKAQQAEGVAGGEGSPPSKLPRQARLQPIVIDSPF